MHNKIYRGSIYGLKVKFKEKDFYLFPLETGSSPALRSHPSPRKTNSIDKYCV